MFQTHCYDAWLNPGARKTKFFMWSQIGGTLPAPLFLFLAGISFALVTDKLLQKGISAGQIGRTTILRGAEIFGLGLLFRLQEFVIALGWAPWSDLLRVDILNTIGLSMMLMGGMCWMVLMTLRPRTPRFVLGVSAAGVASAISLLTPLLWTTWRVRFLSNMLAVQILVPVVLESGIDKLRAMRQMCALRWLEVAVLSVSILDEASKARFADKYDLNFPLLADADHAVAEKYGVWQKKSLYGRSFLGIVRTTYLIDRNGKIARRWDNVKVDGHAEEVMTAIDQL